MAMLPSVFVSYSRKDSGSIQYAVSLLEAGGADVFRDLDDIQFGERWEDVITSRIRACERVLVFWSKSAQQSEWVGREYQLAIKLGKTLVPVLLDSTPLPADLGAFHALTLANFMPKAPRWQRYGGWVIGGVATTALAGVLSFQFFQNSSVPVESMSATEIEMMTETETTHTQAGADAAGVSAELLVSGEEQSLSADSAKTQAGTEAHSAPSHSLTEDNTRDETAKPDSGGESGGDTNINSPPNAKTAQALPGNAPDGSEDSNVEQMQQTPVWLWIVGILALLSLFWLALRRFTQTREREQLANSERFVEMVFDD